MEFFQIVVEGNVNRENVRGRVVTEDILLPFNWHKFIPSFRAVFNVKVSFREENRALFAAQQTIK